MLRKFSYALFGLALMAGSAAALQVINDVLEVDGGILTTPTATACRNIHVGHTSAQVAADGVDATPVATEVYIGELLTDRNCLATGVAVMNGSVASGNIKVGIADAAGGIVASSASTAMSGTDAYQLIPFVTATQLIGPKRYFILEFVDNGTARINTFGVGAFGAAKQTGQVYATGFTTITAPTTFTTALAPIASLY